MNYKYYIADVFTTRIFQGAQIAVFPHAKGLDKDTMQHIAKEMNLSETVFVFNPSGKENQRRIRTFSAQKELDFAGHPLIATAWVLAHIKDINITGEHTKITCEQQAGSIDAYVTVEDDQLKLVQFSTEVKATVDRFVPTDQELADFLGLKIEELENKQFNPMLVFSGINYLVVPIRNYASVRKARFNLKSWSSSSAPATLSREILLVTSTPGKDLADFHGRIVGPDIGDTEDPPIGTAMPAFAAYLCQHDQISQGTHTFSVDRGTESTRRSKLNIEMDNKPDDLVIRVGGPAVLVAEGQLNLPNAAAIERY